MKRNFELETRYMENLDKKQLRAIIKNSKGLTVMAEAVISIPPFIGGGLNPEIDASFGVDMIRLNTFNFEKPFVFGIDADIHLAKGIEEFLIRASP